MITKDEIKNAVDNLPNSLLEEVYSYLKNISLKSDKQVSEEEVKKNWEEWWANLKDFSPDFMNERIQPPLEIRESLFD